MTDPEASKYVSGFGVHWYQNIIAPPSVLTETHNKFPNQFILATEACEGDFVTLIYYRTKFKYVRNLTL